MLPSIYIDLPRLLIFVTFFSQNCDFLIKTVTFCSKLLLLVKVVTFLYKLWLEQEGSAAAATLTPTFLFPQFQPPLEGVI